MAFVQNLPFICILISLFTGPLSSILDGKTAKKLNLVMITAVGIMSAMVLAFTISSGTSYTYMMGHFPAPWGNEIRVGVLEALMATAFSVIMLLCIVGGSKEREEELESTKQNLYSIMANLLSTDYRQDVHVIEEKTATALLVKQPDGSYRLGDESDITIGERCYLLLPNGGIVRTSPVCSWRKYGGF